MAFTIMTLERAKREIIKLQHFVKLIETFQPSSLDQEIVKEYAKTSSIATVCKNLNASHEKVVDVITSIGKDELHRMVRTTYMNKTRQHR